MTRKDYVAIAEAVMSARREITLKEPHDSREDLDDGVSYAAEFIADVMARDNPRFDRARFLKACGVQS